MKKVFIISVILVFSCVSFSWAALLHEQDITVSGIDLWDKSSLEVDVFFDDSTLLYTYNYTFIVDKKDISHVIIEVTDDNPLTPVNDEAFTEENIFDGTTAAGEIGFYDDQLQGNSNPGLDGFYGIKWDTTEDDTTFQWIIVTDRAPMMGSFYAKSGVVNERVNGVTVKTELYAQADGVRVPDTETYAPVSEPATMLLLGAGLIGLAGFGRKSILKKK